ncbi:hypothetical protein CANINC_003724 [Pichia inconspicua]|uniref:C2H2-type domain-containing protein n=1 Tax=Pichia inconspicua TaxID=52247 RepID=A0A4T0WY14_9ASCO|nr:hypothetical protein CANINC_003724 [[Candida] inconspicua]
MSDQIKLSNLINSTEAEVTAGSTNIENITDTPNIASNNFPSSLTQAINGDDSNSGNILDLSSTDVENTAKPKSKHRGRKKVLSGPPYYCTYPGCDKSFQRSEHLSRHKLNHNPKTIFSCTFTGCSKTFVRHDLLNRHLKRHNEKIQKVNNDNKSNGGFLNSVVSRNIFALKKNKPATTNITNAIPSKDITQLPNNQTDISNSTAYRALDTTSNYSINQQNNQNIQHSPQYSDIQSSTSNLNLFGWLFPDSINFNSSNTNSNNISNLSQMNNNPTNFFQEPQLNPATLINSNFSNFNSPSNHATNSSSNFLSDLNDFHMNNNTHNFFTVQDHFSPGSSSGCIDSTPESDSRVKMVSNGNTGIGILSHMSHNIAPLQSFQHSQGHQNSTDHSMLHYDENLLYKLTQEQMMEFGRLIPALKSNQDFTKLKFEKALKTYWNFFHPRFPMLHRPTFKSVEAPILLLAAMIVLGSKLFMCVDNITCPEDSCIKQPNVLSDTISEPLRWLLFASPFFQPPAEVWIIQSLLMLEFYEKHCSSRKLHERSHLHHGTTIQLLRRSPTLGGASTKFNNESNSNGNEDIENWYKWIEIESMKRATFMCFYMDAIDAICMGHQMFIYSHQIQMTMPVEDVIWESSFNKFNKNFKLFKRPKQFLLVLRNIMNGKSTKTNSFGKKILLAGLSAILFQIQQRDLQLFFGLDKFTSTISENWRDLLTAAFAIWRNDVGTSCCSSKTAIDNLNSLGNSSQFSTSDTRCKCIAYHLAHIYMSISHYDVFIVCGAPWRMNVKPSSHEERMSIKTRVIEWSKTRHCEVSIVQCYLSMFEMFLSPQDSTYDYQYEYLPDADLFFRSYSIGYMLLVIWSYLYVKTGFEGIDSTHNNNLNGYEYLKNIRTQFTVKSEGVLLHTWFTNQTGAEFYGDLMRWVNVLPEIDGLMNVVGLLDLVGESFIKAEFKVVKEIGKLLLFCKDRALGKTDMEILEDMYFVD